MWLERPYGEPLEEKNLTDIDNRGIVQPDRKGVRAVRGCLPKQKSRKPHQVIAFSQGELAVDRKVGSQV